VAAYNYQVHCAHRDREDGRRSPAKVLSWIMGTVYPDEALRRIFTVRFGRRFDPQGYVRFGHWRLYGERGLAAERGAIWLYGEKLTVHFADDLSAQYTIGYERDQRRLKSVSTVQRFATSGARIRRRRPRAAQGRQGYRLASSEHVVAAQIGWTGRKKNTNPAMQ
jgi:hypothetical protein